MKRRTFHYAAGKAVPVMLGYVALGVGFGVILRDKGYSAWWALGMSVFVYAGSMQYVGADLLAEGASLVSTLLISVVVSARQLFYGVSMVEKYRSAGRARPYLIFALTDETYSVVCDAELPEDVDGGRFYLYVSLLNHIAWVTGCVAGALIGGLLSFDTTGIDFVMTAIFVVIFVEQWEKTREHFPAILGVSVTVVCRLIFGASSFLIPAMIGITAGLFAMRGRLDGGGEGGGEP